MTKLQTLPSKSESWRMFDEISPRYDFLNHFLSFGLDRRWRRKLVSFLPPKVNQRLLDLATGTADTILSFFRYSSRVNSAVGIDLADKMLEIGRLKVKQKKLQDKIVLKHADANQIPFEAQTFDIVSMAFGIRNVVDPLIILKEMSRVLKGEGRTLILEFSLPSKGVIRAIHLFYLRTVVPLIGWIFSQNYHAYRYLNLTIEEFPYGENFCRLMREAGFKAVKANPLFFGAATIYQGDK